VTTLNTCKEMVKTAVLMMMFVVWYIQLDKDISAYTYEKTLAMEQRSAMLNMMRKQRLGSANQQQQQQRRELPVAQTVSFCDCLSGHELQSVVDSLFSFHSVDI